MTHLQLARLIRASNITETARLAGISRRSLHHIANMEHSPSLEVVERILDALGGKASPPKVSRAKAKEADGD